MFQHILPLGVARDPGLCKRAERDDGPAFGARVLDGAPNESLPHRAASQRIGPGDVAPLLSPSSRSIERVSGGVAAIIFPLSGVLPQRSNITAPP